MLLFYSNQIHSVMELLDLNHPYIFLRFNEITCIVNCCLIKKIIYKFTAYFAIRHNYQLPKILY